MNIPNYIRTERAAMADRLGVHEQFLHQIGRGFRQASPALARQIHALDSRMALQWLRPDDWQKIWPELDKGVANG